MLSVNRCRAEGIDVLTGVKVKAVEQTEGRAAVVFEDREGVRKLEADAVLIATGRRPNTKELNLEAAGIEVNARGGIITDDSMMTTAPDVMLWEMSPEDFSSPIFPWMTAESSNQRFSETAVIH